MLPELLGWPINPPYKLKDKVAKYLKEIGIYQLLKEIKYRIDNLTYRLKALL
jgi:hypothetical protein